MKLYVPEYYKKFVCSAGNCRHSCCVGWEIDIDGETAVKYLSMNTGYGRKIKESVESIEDDENGNVNGNSEYRFRLDENEKCPHLNENGLCNIIINLGEEYLCDICRLHPRFFNDTAYGREAGLGMVCEEACRLILSSDEYDKIEEIKETEDTEDTESCIFGEYDPISDRKRVYEILALENISYFERRRQIENEFEVSPDMISDEEWKNIITYSLEYLNEEHKKIFLNFSSNPKPSEELEKKLQRALAYFVYRHCTPAYDKDEFRASLGMSLFLERLIASAVILTGMEAEEVAGIVSEEIEYSTENTDALKNVFYISFYKEEGITAHDRLYRS